MNIFTFGMLKEFDHLNLGHLITTRRIILIYCGLWKDLPPITTSYCYLEQGIIPSLNFFQKWKDSAIPSIPTFNKIKSSMAKSWVVKERKGSASRKIGLNLSAERAAKISKDLIDPIFQPFIVGKEFSAETWVSHINKCHGVLLRWRDKVVNGESHHTTVFRNSIWEAKLKKVFDPYEVFI